jgi:hypothetical protein
MNTLEAGIFRLQPWRVSKLKAAPFMAGWSQLRYGTLNHLPLLKEKLLKW